FGSSLGYVAGPTIGGLLVAAGGAGIVFALNAASFVVSAALVATVRGSFAGLRTDVEEEVHRGTRAGFVFLWNDPVLRRVTSAAAVFAVSVGSILVAELPLAAAFGAGALGYGLLGTSFDFGAIFGALGPKAAYALGGAGCVASALMMLPLLRTRAPAPRSPEVDRSPNPDLPFIGDAGP